MWVTIAAWPCATVFVKSADRPAGHGRLTRPLWPTDPQKEEPPRLALHQWVTTRVWPCATALKGADRPEIHSWLTLEVWPTDPRGRLAPLLWLSDGERNSPISETSFARSRSHRFAQLRELIRVQRFADSLVADSFSNAIEPRGFVRHVERLGAIELRCCHEVSTLRIP